MSAATDRDRSAGTCDALVIGAGPAGATAARLLAEWGRDVALAHRPGPPPGMEEETMVAGASGLLERLSLLDVARRFPGAPRHRLAWGEARVVEVEGGGSGGFQLEREAFDAELRRLAAQRGARIVEGSELPEARVTIVATGRDAPASRFEATVEDELLASLAIEARIGRAGDPPGAANAEDGTVIEAVREGWLWWLPLRRGGVLLTLFADRDEVKARGRDEVWRAALAGAIGPARMCDALPDRAVAVGPRLRSSAGTVLLAGDAAASVDPLSSQGVEKALASAEHAALCANTVLEGGVDHALVFAHRRAWERRLWRVHRSGTLAFYRRERRFADAPFWRARQALPDERLDRPRSGLPARFGPHPSIEPAAVLRRRGALLEATRGWRMSGSEETLAHVGSLPIGPLLESCTPSATLDEALARAARHPELCALSPRGVALGFQELVEEGWIVAAR